MSKLGCPYGKWLVASQKSESQNDMGHVVMPARPSARFIFIEPKRLFGLFKDNSGASWARPTYGTNIKQFGKGRIGGCIGKERVNLRRVIEMAA